MNVYAAIAAVFAFLAILPALSSPQEQEPPEATSLDGKPLHREPLLPQDLEARKKLEENLAKAEADVASDPGNAESILWLGRRLAYLHRYHDAIEVFDGGIELYPYDPRFFRHRGHRYITLRRFDEAEADLEKAAALMAGKPLQEEPSGTGGRASSLQFNVWYHLGLARYLKGDFARAIEAYRQCMEVSTDDESKVATSDWLYMTLRRNKDAEQAAAVLEGIREDMEITENTAYHQRLLMYKGLLAPEVVLNPEEAEPLQVATQGYGVANWYFYNGETEKARELLLRVVGVGFWPAFGHIAAEVDLMRLREGGQSSENSSPRSE